MRLFLAGIFLPTLAWAAILPETLGPYHRAATMQVTILDRPIWDEYGLKESEAARYENAGKDFTVTAWRLQDSTGAMAAFEWQRPAKSTANKLAGLAAETADGVLLAYGNYLLGFTGYKPSPEDLAALLSGLRNVDATVLPALPGYLPEQDLVPNSQRYITGPASLQKFHPGISPSLAAFHFGAEAQFGVFRGPKGEMAMAIFNYPNHHIAMKQAEEFGKLAGAVVKRSGPLVAVVLNPPDPDAAERVLAQVRYQAQVTRDEYVPTRRDNIGSLLLNAFILIGILLAFSLVSGLALGGFRAFLRRGKKGEEADAMISLHLR